MHTAALFSRYSWSLAGCALAGFRPTSEAAAHRLGVALVSPSHLLRPFSSDLALGLHIWHRHFWCVLNLRRDVVFDFTGLTRLNVADNGLAASCYVYVFDCNFLLPLPTMLVQRCQLFCVE